MARRRLVLQTLLFRRTRFTPAEAERWLRAHHYEMPEPDVQPHVLRYRQRDPGRFAASSFRTVRFGVGIEAVMGHLKRATRPSIDELFR